MPSGQRSAAIATPLIRGTVAIASRAQGFSVWLRSQSAGTTVRVLAMANVGTPEQISATFPESIVPTAVWSRFDFRFDQLARFPLGNLDQIVFEISGNGPSLIGFDDLEWTGI